MFNPQSAASRSLITAHWLAAVLLALTPNVIAAQEKSNPFTGTTAAFEQRLRVLEEKKLDAAIANEELAAEKANQERLRLRSGRIPGSPEPFAAPPSPLTPNRNAPATVTAPLTAQIRARP